MLYHIPVRSVHFNLRSSRRKQQEAGIEDNRDPAEYLEVLTDQLKMKKWSKHKHYQRWKAALALAREKNEDIRIAIDIRELFKLTAHVSSWPEKGILLIPDTR